MLDDRGRVGELDAHEVQRQLERGREELARAAYEMVRRDMGPVLAAIPHRAAAFLEREQVRSYYEDDAEVVFKPIRAFFAMHGLDARFVMRIGPAAASIAKLAQQGRFDLLVMGSHGHGAAVGLLMGSVATKVLALCTTPVLLIR